MASRETLKGGKKVVFLGYKSGRTCGKRFHVWFDMKTYLRCRKCGASKTKHKAKKPSEWKRDPRIVK